MDAEVRHVGYYYSGWLWKDRAIEFVKHSLLFFDTLAMSVPSEKVDQVLDTENVLARPIYEMGLLENYPPLTTLTKRQAVELSSKLTKAVELLEIGPAESTHSHWYEALDLMASPRPVLTGLHYGLRPSNTAAHAFAKTLFQKGLATLPDDSKAAMFKVEPNIRSLILHFYADAFRRAVRKRTGSGVEIEPFTDSQSILRATYGPRGLLQNAGSPTMRLILADSAIADRLWIPLDVSKMPLDEILDVRRLLSPDLRAYRKALRSHVANLSERDRNPSPTMKERRQEIIDYAETLKRKARLNVKRGTVSALFGVAGAAWTTRTGDPAGAFLALASAMAGLPRNDAGRDVSQYSYLLKLRQRP